VVGNGRKRLIDVGQAGGTGENTLQKADNVLGGAGPFPKAVAVAIRLPNGPASVILKDGLKN